MRSEDIWRALDLLAAKHQLSASGLARRAGLDATAFNPSKRLMSTGRARWLNTESLAKVLAATGTTLSEFTALVNVKGDKLTVPMIGFAEAGKEGFFDLSGFPAGAGWDEVMLPDIKDPNAYALEISDASLEPAYRQGDAIVVSPATRVRRGDRVVFCTRGGEVMVKLLVRQSARRVELKSINPEKPDRSFEVAQVAWMHRIIWVTQ